MSDSLRQLRAEKRAAVAEARMHKARADLAYHHRDRYKAALIEVTQGWMKGDDVVTPMHRAIGLLEELG